jgi:perosamine synthetase
MSELALLGGTPSIRVPLRPYVSIGEEERIAVDAIMRTGALSGYIGAVGEGFYGGRVVREFESQFSAMFRVKHALAVNSNTTGMVAALGAAGISPGDEVIMPPTTMSATAMAPLIYGGIPVFVDIEPDTFCLDVDQVVKAITPKTRAILAVSIFGHPAPLHALRSLADRHGILLIEDNAQAPLARENDRYAGTIGHLGVFSFNYHKHIHVGEGGMCVTDDDRLATRIAMIRNHGENAVGQLDCGDMVNMVGFNFRMTELQAAIGLAQLKKVEPLVARREAVAQRLTRELGKYDGIVPPSVRAGCRHVYYQWTARFDARKVGVSREVFVRALAAEGVPIGAGYVQPLYMLPVFQSRIAIGRDGFPFTLTDRKYAKGLCPVAEKMHERELIGIEVCSFLFDDPDIGAVAAAFDKVYAGRRELSKAAP